MSSSATFNARIIQNSISSDAGYRPFSTAIRLWCLSPLVLATLPVSFRIGEPENANRIRHPGGLDQVGIFLRVRTHLDGEAK